MRNNLASTRRMSVLGASLTILIVLAGCGKNDKLLTPGNPVNTGSADFTSYVAIGNSLTAGFQSGALSGFYSYHSFPRLIAEQAGVDTATWEQPIIADPGIGVFALQGGGRLSLDPATLAITPIPLDSAQAANPASMLENATYPEPYRNLGIPEALAVEIPTATTSANSISHSPFFDLILRNPAFGNTTVVQQALMLHPTFVTIWLGNNDVLGWAFSGGTATSPPSPTSDVSAAISSVVTQLKAASTHPNIAIANIPNIDDIPYFTYIKPYLTDLRTGTPIIVDGSRVYLIGPGGNPLTDSDRVLLSALPSIEAGTGVPAGVPVGISGATGNGQPLGNEFVLNAAEQSTIQTTIADYNAAIKQIADNNDCALVDINAAFHSIATQGYGLGGTRLTPAMVTGGIFSLDGIHPNTVGYGIVANAFIDAINAKFGGEIPRVNLGGLFNY